MRSSHELACLPFESFEYLWTNLPVLVPSLLRQMMVTFHKGTLRTETGAEVTVSWAESDFGVTALISGSDELVHELELEQITDVELVTTLDLPSLDRQGVEVIVGNILKGRYLDMPGVKGKGDAVLFILVNEALHQLAEIAEDENED